MYKLISVLIHQGQTCNSGHYYCFVRNSNNCWYRMDDNHVSQVRLDEVLDQRAYILFYIRQHSENSIRTVRLAVFPIIVYPFVFYNNQQMSDNLKISVNSNSASIKKCDINQKSNGIFNSNFKFTLNQSPMKTTLSQKTHTPIISTNLYNDNKQQSQDSHVRITTNPVKLNSSAALSTKSNNNSNGLVPYDNDHDVDSDVESTSRNKQPKMTIPATIIRPRPTVTISHKDKSGHSVNGNNNKDGISLLKQPIQSSSTSVLQPKEPKIAIKVKATTNSWKVIEATQVKPSKIQENCAEKSIKIEMTKSKNRIESVNTNWRISETTISSSSSFSDEINTQSSCSNSGAEDSSNRSESDKNANDIVNTAEISSSKQQQTLTIDNDKSSTKKKKKRKKEKSKKRKHSDADMELNWVERTKETLEMENGIDRTLNEHKKLKTESSSRSNVLDVLLKNVSNGYGDVKSWNGGISILQKSMLDKTSSAINDDDLYNEEFDQGKPIKVKSKIDPFKNISPNGVNPFQAMQQSKYNNGDKHHYNSNNSFNGKKFKLDKNHHSHNNNNNNIGNKYHNSTKSNRFHCSSTSSTKLIHGRHQYNNNNNFHHNHRSRSSFSSKPMNSSFKYR
ncbi:hypothetical protein BLA29_001758 [Euroglyphus maynei]|uniref:Ubiquitin carboxyl-terminal hydrolase 36 n=1 Tax=Euroglyphus maynei TaxID=6958 RepID=A0A1Y3B2I2_EURMA|nr:hypothetical protein BLA29_001758 [Euroglyphus maynei]